jgi:hypothetical protein
MTAWMKIPLQIACALGAACMLASSALGQEVPPSGDASHSYSIGADFGVNDFHLKDTYLSPYIYRGAMFSSHLSMQAALWPSRHSIDARFSRGHINSDEQPRDVAQTMGSFSYAWSHSLFMHEDPSRAFDAFIGIGISTTISNTDFLAADPVYNYYLMDRSWYWAHAVDVHAAAEYHPAAHTFFSLQCRAPLFQLVSRPSAGHYFEPRNAEIAQNFWHAAGGGAPEYLWDHLVLTGTAEASQQLTGSFGIRAAYTFGYCSNGSPMRNAWLMNTIQGGFFLQL